jgi:hypothetical protein
MTIIARLEPKDPSRPVGGIIQIGKRPDKLDGCMQTWTETYEQQVMRTNMESPGYVKVRRRVTGKTTNIDASVTLNSNLYDDIQHWFFEDSQAGVIPTRVKRPQDGKEIVVRFKEPPTVDFIEKGIISVNFKFEQLPAWVTLV